MKKFFWLANWPALDFVNTEIVQAGKRVDLLETGADVFDWLGQAGYRVSCSPGVPAYKVLAAARQYRQQLRSGLQGLVSKRKLPADLIASTNRLLQRNTSVVQLAPEHGKRAAFRLERSWLVREPEDACAPVAHSFAELLAAANLRRVRRCKNPECVLFFYDTSRSATRSWCSLDICGNKQRVAAFRRRHSR